MGGAQGVIGVFVVILAIDAALFGFEFLQYHLGGK